MLLNKAGNSIFAKKILSDPKRVWHNTEYAVQKSGIPFIHTSSTSPDYVKNINVTLKHLRIPIFIIFSYLDISSIQNKFDDFDKIVKDNNDFRCDLANTTFWRLSLKWGLWFPGNIFLGVFFIKIGKKLFSKVGWTLILYILLQIFD